MLVEGIFRLGFSVLSVYFRKHLKEDRAFGCIEPHLGLNIHIVVLNQSSQFWFFQYQITNSSCSFPRLNLFSCLYLIYIINLNLRNFSL